MSINQDNTDYERILRICRTLLTRVIPRPLLFFDIELTEHCNLNCKGCGSFAPLADEEYVDVSELKRDLQKLSELSGGEVHHINILGGEPLLHPDICEIMKICRNLFEYGNINIVTNGLLLPKMNDDFWDTCKESNITVAVTKYPVNFDYTLPENKAKNMGVNYCYFGNASEYWYHNVMKETGNMDELQNFLHCGNANKCPVLSHGKIYPCPRAAKINHFNKKFDNKFRISKKDYINIHEVNDLDEVMNFLCRPIPFCRYCDTFSGNITEWEQSNGDESEWT